MKISLSKEIIEMLRRRQEQNPEKTIDEIANDVLRKQIAVYIADPELLELELKK